MGDELADGIEMGIASGREFRTAPLWGVGATGPYLHDGRADTLDAAIRLHGGEAAARGRVARPEHPRRRDHVEDPAELPPMPPRASLARTHTKVCKFFIGFNEASFAAKSITVLLAPFQFLHTHVCQCDFLFCQVVAR